MSLQIFDGSALAFSLSLMRTGTGMLEVVVVKGNETLDHLTEKQSFDTIDTIDPSERR
jgi:hypothetical protein